MTSSNINKIVRSNITLKPWILSKNTSEIVNACIQKIYKQSQNNFKNDPSKIAAAKPENKGPIRALKSQERVHLPLSINVSRAKKGATGSNSTPSGNAGTAAATTGGVSERLASNAAANNRRGAVANLAAHRKLLKSSPNYKIYSSRRFGSSASSSNASIFRRNDERRRSTTQTAQLNYLLRTYATQLNARPRFANDSILPKFMVSARNQHMQRHTDEASATHVAQFASAIQRDLMPINSALKDRIALGRPRLSKMAAQKAKNHDPMNGWHHPPSQELFLSRVNQRGIANVELQEQYRRMKNANKMRQFEQLRQMEKRSAILGAVGKKVIRQQVLDQFDVHDKDLTPRESPKRNKTPNFEDSYVTRVMRQQVDEADTVAPIPLPMSDVPQAQASTSTPPVAQVTNTAQSKAISQNMQTIAQPQTTNEDRYASNESSGPLAIAPPTTSTTTAKPLSLPAPATAQPEASPPMMPKQFLRITKHSATSQLSKAAAQAAAQHQMRFNHIEHLKKF